MGFCSIEPINVPTKLEVCSFTRSRDNRGTQKLLGVPEYAHAPFSPKFLMGFVRMDTVNGPVKFEVCYYVIPEITAIGVLGGSCEPPIVRKGKP